MDGVRSIAAGILGTERKDGVPVIAHGARNIGERLGSLQANQDGFARLRALQKKLRLDEREGTNLAGNINEIIRLFVGFLRFGKHDSKDMLN